MTYRGHETRVYPPFSNQAPEEFGVQQVRLDRIPRLPETTPPHIGAAQLKRAEMTLSWSDGATRSDAIRVDIGADDPSLAISFVDRLLELMRFLTFQWWITRDRRFDDSYLRNSFGINERGERVSEVASMMKGVGRVGIERVMDEVTFRSVSHYAAAEQQTPASIVSLLDALYFFQTEDYRRFVIEAAVACEVLLVEHGRLIAADRGLSRRVVKRELEKPDFEDRFTFGLTNFLGRSFAADEPAHYEWILAMWIARNNVAHGKAAMTRHGGRTIRPTRDDFTHMVKAVLALFMWYQAFQTYSPQPGI